ncbi:MAG TPA: c-type cytochrome [Terriglobales bacterium]|nr:c-type cytochrome [Terriglobales bacterium]
MEVRYLIWPLALVLMSAAASAGQEASGVKHAPAQMTSPASGKEMFMNYCASCHGKDAKGDGPAAAALKQAPADLTMLAKQNGGKYPADKVTSILRGQASLAAHGNQEMPVWGPVFWSMSQGHEEMLQLRIANLNRYLESLQVK